MLKDWNMRLGSEGGRGHENKEGRKMGRFAAMAGSGVNISKLFFFFLFANCRARLKHARGPNYDFFSGRSHCRSLILSLYRL